MFVVRIINWKVTKTDYLLSTILFTHKKFDRTCVYVRIVLDHWRLFCHFDLCTQITPPVSTNENELWFTNRKYLHYKRKSGDCCWLNVVYYNLKHGKASSEFYVDLLFFRISTKTMYILLLYLFFMCNCKVSYKSIYRWYHVHIKTFFFLQILLKSFLCDLHEIITRH